MKRQSDAVAKDMAFVLKVEAEDDDDERGRKRVKLVSQNEDKCAPSMDIKDSIDASSCDELNHVSLPNHLSVQFSEAQTSTPIPQNGTVTDKNINQDICASPSLSQGSSSCNIISNIEVPVSNHMLESSSVNGYQSNKENNTSTSSLDKEADHTNGTDETSPQTVSMSNEDVEVDVVGHDIILSSNNLNEKVDKSNLDVECFLGSYLDACTLDGHADDILSVVADGDTILSASADTTIKMWDPVKNKEMCNFQGHSASVTALVLLTKEQTSALVSKMNVPDIPKILISASLDCSVRLWAVPAGVELLSFYTYNGITCLQYIEKEHQVIIGTDGGKLEIWDLCSSKVIYSTLAHENGVSCLKVDDCQVYSASTDGMVKVWILEEDELNNIYTRKRKQHSRNSLKLEPSLWKCLDFHGDLLYLGDNTPYLKVLHWKEGRLRILKTQTHKTAEVDAVCIKDDILLSSFYDVNSQSSGINVWQLPTMTYVCSLLGEMDRVSSLAVTMTEDKILRVVSGGEKLLVWNFVYYKKPSTNPNTNYYCQEIELLNEEEFEENSELSPRNSKISGVAKPTEVEENNSKSWPCLVM